MNRIDLTGRRAVVTGGAQGLGRAITERLAASGAAVEIWDIQDGPAQAAAAEIGGGPAIIPSIAGWARMTGINTIFIDDRDPFAHGFVVR